MREVQTVADGAPDHGMEPNLQTLRARDRGRGKAGKPGGVDSESEEHGAAKMIRSISFIVAGRPVPMPHGITYKNKWKKEIINHPVWAWRDRVAWAAKLARVTGWPLTCPVSLSLDFRTARNAGDLKNYTWACEDAMTGIVFLDDKQVWDYVPPFRKRKASPVGVTISVYWEDNA
jgi:Holliday junction resolvase RusA-like endonuclease